MGLVAEVQELRNEYKKAQQEAEKSKKELEKLQQKKEYEKNIKEEEKIRIKAVEYDLIETFSKCFERDGYEKGFINLRLKATRDEILNNVPENDVEWHYINNNYERILNKVKRIYENDQKAKNTLKQIELQQKLIEEQKKQQKYNIIKTIFLSIFNIIKWVFAGIFILICIILKDASKKE